MKRFYLVVVGLFFFHHLFGKIKNGYEPQLEASRTSLQRLLILEEGQMSPAERLMLKTRINNLIDLISFCDLTDEFIRQFKIVAPIMFTELDNITDKQGRLTDIYIRLIPAEKFRIPLSAASFFEQMKEDEDANISQFGLYSVSVDVTLVHNSLLLLSHELGHVKHIVPNLAEYTKFYKWRYGGLKTGAIYMGHGSNDQSGKESHIFERRFFEEQKTYFRRGGKKPMPLFSLLSAIRKNTKNRESVYPLLFASNDKR